MPYAMVPSGYRAVPIGQAANIEELGTFTPLEEGAAEGALFLMRLDFEEEPSQEALAQMELAFRDAGVESWPGYGFFVYTDENSPTIYLAWQKGFAWLPIIIGILATTVLPPLLMAGVWLILPESLKSFISGLVNLGMMALMMFLVVKMMPALAPEKKKPRQIEESKT